MNRIKHKDCYGTMFPDSLHMKNNVPNRGKVFAATVELVGGMARGDRSIETDIEEWDDCQQCPEFESCYKLCLAKTSLRGAISTR